MTSISAAYSNYHKIHNMNETAAATLLTCSMQRI